MEEFLKSINARTDQGLLGVLLGYLKETDTFYHQFRLIKASEYYLFNQLLVDVVTETGNSDIEKLFKFFAPLKSSNIVRALLTRFFQHIDDLFIKNADKQLALIALIFHLTAEKLVDFDQIKPFILHTIFLLNPAKRELSWAIMDLLNMCIIVLSREAVTFLNEEKAYKNTLIEDLITQIIQGNDETRTSVFELLHNLKQYDCLQSEQNTIIIEHLGTQNWKIDILLLVRLGYGAILSNALCSKISFQFVNNICEGLINLDLKSRTIHNDLFISSGLLIYTMQSLQHLFWALLLEGTSINDNVREELEKIIELLRNVENELNCNPQYAEKERDIEMDNSEEVTNSEVDD